MSEAVSRDLQLTDGTGSPAGACLLPLQAWAVPDAALRYVVKDALSDQLMPLYEAFVNKYKGAAYTGGWPMLVDAVHAGWLAGKGRQEPHCEGVCPAARAGICI
jgi:hypothetical protein